MKQCLHPTLVAALFTVAKAWTLPYCPSADKRTERRKGRHSACTQWSVTQPSEGSPAICDTWSGRPEGVLPAETSHRKTHTVFYRLLVKSKESQTHRNEEQTGVPGEKRNPIWESCCWDAINNSDTYLHDAGTVGGNCSHPKQDTIVT